MKYIRSLNAFVVISLIFFVLSGCAPMYETTYTYEPPRSNTGKVCVMQCQQSKSLCNRLCQSDYRNCLRDAKANARFNYEEYKSAQIASNMTIDRDLNSFYNPLQCRKPNCQCEPDYKECFQMCGGKVTPHRTCVAFCND